MPSIAETFLIVVLSASGSAWAYAGWYFASRRPVFKPAESPRQSVSDYALASVCLLLAMMQLLSSSSSPVTKRIESKSASREWPTAGDVDSSDSDSEETTETTVEHEGETRNDDVLTANLLNSLIFEAMVLWILVMIHRVSQPQAPTISRPVAIAPTPQVVSSSSATDTRPVRRSLRPGYEILQGALAFLLCLPWVILLIQLLRRFTNDSSVHELLEVAQHDPSPLLLFLVFAHAVVMAPLLEELEFRVILQGWMADRAPGWFAILLPAFIFCGVHRIPDAFALFPLALALGWLYHRRRSYIGVVTTHLLFNLFNLVLTLSGP